MGELPIVERLRAWDEYGEYDILTESRPSRLRNPNGPEAALLITELVAALERGVQWKGAWREAIVELEDFCSEPVRLRNMIAAADALDDWASESRAVLARARSKGGE